MIKNFSAFMATIAFASSLASPIAIAGEADVRKALSGRVSKVDKLAKAPMAGWWEVIADGRVFYVDDKGTYVMIGALIETKTDKNLTAERQNGIAKDLIAGQLKNAVKQVRGNGKNVLVTFEDPNCGYCKKLAREVQKLKNATVYTFLYPVLGEDSMEKSKAIWCAGDRAKAWNDQMLNGKASAAAPEGCDTSGLEAAIDLGRKLDIGGTPAMFFSNGERTPGYMPAEEIESRFARTGS
jgi:thiol:disulfide interchange protein DsbC